VVSAGSLVNSPSTTTVCVDCVVDGTSYVNTEDTSVCVVSVKDDDSTWLSIVVSVFGITVVRVALDPMDDAGLNDPIAVEPAEADAAHITSLPTA